MGHAASIASALFFKTVLESRRGDITATRLTVEALLALTEELNLKTYTDLGQVYANWVRGKQGDPYAAALGLRRALASYLTQGNKSGAPSFYGLLAELEAARFDQESALVQRSMLDWQSLERIRGSITPTPIFIVSVAKSS